MRKWVLRLSNPSSSTWPSASRFLSALAQGWWTPACSSMYVLLWGARWAERQACCLGSEGNPAQHRWLHRLLRHPYYRCHCIQLRFYLFPIPVFREFHFSLSSPAPPLRQHQIKKPITLPHPKKAFEKGGRHGFNVLKLQNCKPQTSKRVGYSRGLLALWKQLSGHRRLWGARRL